MQILFFQGQKAIRSDFICICDFDKRGCLYEKVRSLELFSKTLFSHVSKSLELTQAGFQLNLSIHTSRPCTVVQPGKLASSLLIT